MLMNKRPVLPIKFLENIPYLFTNVKQYSEINGINTAVIMIRTTLFFISNLFTTLKLDM